MMSIVVTIVIVGLIGMLYLTTDEDRLYGYTLKDKEFEKEFIYLVSRIDKSNINWTLKALTNLKNGYRHYEDNDKAMSIIRVLRRGVRDNDPRVISYIKVMSKM